MICQAYWQRSLYHDVQSFMHGFGHLLRLSRAEFLSSFLFRLTDLYLKNVFRRSCFQYLQDRGIIVFGYDCIFRPGLAIAPRLTPVNSDFLDLFLYLGIFMLLHDCIHCVSLYCRLPQEAGQQAT